MTEAGEKSGKSSLGSWRWLKLALMFMLALMLGRPMECAREVRRDHAAVPGVVVWWLWWLWLVINFPNNLMFLLCSPLLLLRVRFHLLLLLFTVKASMQHVRATKRRALGGEGGPGRGEG